MRQRLEQAKLREQLDKQRQEQSSVEPANTTPGGAPDGTTTPASSTPTAPDPSPSAGDVNPMSLQDVKSSRQMAPPTGGSDGASGAPSPLQVLQSAMTGGPLAGQYETGGRRLSALRAARRLGPR